MWGCYYLWRCCAWHGAATVVNNGRAGGWLTASRLQRNATTRHVIVNLVLKNTVMFIAGAWFLFENDLIREDKLVVNGNVMATMIRMTMVTVTNDHVYSMHLHIYNDAFMMTLIMLEMVWWKMNEEDQRHGGGVEDDEEEEEEEEGGRRGWTWVVILMMLPSYSWRWPIKMTGHRYCCLANTWSEDLLKYICNSSSPNIIAYISARFLHSTSLIPPLCHPSLPFILSRCRRCQLLHVAGNFGKCFNCAL